AALLQERAQRARLGERLGELEVGVPHVEVGEPHGLLFQHLAEQYGQPERVPVEPQRLVRVAHDDGKMIESLEHLPSLQRASLTSGNLRVDGCLCSSTTPRTR